MRLGRIIAILIWLVGLFGLLGSVYTPSQIKEVQLPTWVIFLPAIFFPVAALWGRNPFEAPRLRVRIDKRGGEGAYVSFIRDLKPMLWFAVFGIAGAAVCYFQTFRAGIPVNHNSACGFTLSGGIGFLIARIVVARRGLLMEASSNTPASPDQGPWSRRQDNSNR